MGGRIPVARRAICAVCIVLASSVCASRTRAAEVQNLTGLPAYPNLARAAMDKTAKTDSLGRWCTRFSAETPFPIDIVVAWYRKALVGASETDLGNDDDYKAYASLSGVKLAVGIDYVTVFKVANQAATYIELFRCSHGE